MHIFFFFRGVHQYVEVYKAMIQTQFWQWERTNLKTGITKIELVQGALRESYLGCYEYIFPEECLSEVIAVLGIQETTMFRMKTLRKILGLEKIPKKNFEESKRIVVDMSIKGTKRGLSGIRIPGTGIDVIGIKRDKRGEFFGYYQEGL